jgi:predicted RNA-binding protein YlqC (UPF0109 family)
MNEQINVTEEELLKKCVEVIVDHPEKIEIKKEVGEQGVVLNLEVDPEDVGSVIGKEGKTITAIRQIMRTFGLRKRAWISVKVLTQD